eukprot:CAMPEP_0114278554 /NCGR_PEP_ID=MMETSP0059-20121206/1402_1 /TAXON_ID=36894 /ORGANISM="Pyramimonas parkeae, Strain CCMP726" /LENGTH=154 /DNA_ID=CAMNT_0001398767 /DNA_START=72 /DNA_END=532 /DNA_ORIENTATION=-
MVGTDRTGEAQFTNNNGGHGLALLLESDTEDRAMHSCMASAYGGSPLDRQLRWVLDVSPPPACVPRPAKVHAAALSNWKSSQSRLVEPQTGTSTETISFEGVTQSIQQRLQSIRQDQSADEGDFGASSSPDETRQMSDLPEATERDKRTLQDGA